MKIQFILVLLFLSFSVYFLGCSKSSEPENIQGNYTPLNVGDVRQLVFLSDSSTILMTIVGKTKREDGQEVFVCWNNYGTYIGDTSYYFIKDGYYCVTELDTDLTKKYDDYEEFASSNPFGEQRLGKLYPNDGDFWKQFVGRNDSMYRYANYAGSKNMITGNFPNVFSFAVFDSSKKFADIYFAENIGHIGTSISLEGNTSEFQVSYIKVANKVIGELWPAKPITGFNKIHIKYKKNYFLF